MRAAGEPTSTTSANSATEPYFDAALGIEAALRTGPHLRVGLGVEAGMARGLYANLDAERALPLAGAFVGVLADLAYANWP